MTNSEAADKHHRARRLANQIVSMLAQTNAPWRIDWYGLANEIGALEAIVSDMEAAAIDGAGQVQP